MKTAPQEVLTPPDSAVFHAPSHNVTSIPMRTFRILFACPQTLFYVSNGATMQCYTMLQTLSKLNFQTASIGGGIFDNPSGQARIPNFKEQVSDKSKGEILVNVDSSANPNNPIRHYFFTGFKSTNWNDITSQEAGKFLVHYSKLLRAFKPTSL